MITNSNIIYPLLKDLQVHSIYKNINYSKQNIIHSHLIHKLNLMFDKWFVDDDNHIQLSQQLHDIPHNNDNSTRIFINIYKQQTPFITLSYLSNENIHIDNLLSHIIQDSIPWNYDILTTNMHTNIQLQHYLQINNFIQDSLTQTIKYQIYSLPSQLSSYSPGHEACHFFPAHKTNKHTQSLLEHFQSTFFYETIEHITQQKFMREHTLYPNDGAWKIMPGGNISNLSCHDQSCNAASYTLLIFLSTPATIKHNFKTFNTECNICTTDISITNNTAILYQPKRDSMASIVSNINNDLGSVVLVKNFYTHNDTTRPTTTNNHHINDTRLNTLIHEPCRIVYL